MSSTEWSTVWEDFLIFSRFGRFKEWVKKAVLKDFIRLIRSWAKRSGKANPIILELGCAPGLMLERIHKACPEGCIRGIDYSSDGLEITRQKLRKEGISAELIEQDIFDGDPVCRADLVVSFGLIEHYDDPVEILRAHRKFARPSGYVAVTVPNFSHPFVLRCIKKYRSRDLETHNLCVMSEETLRDLFREAGFVQVETGKVLGPLIPSPAERSLRTAPYFLFSALWNVCSWILPPSVFWPGGYWACARVDSEEESIAKGCDDHDTA